MLAAAWEGLPEELMIQRPGPHPEWSVKDIIAHLCWWENFAISRIAVLAAGLEINPIKDFDRLNKEVDAMVVHTPSGGRAGAVRSQQVTRSST